MRSNAHKSSNGPFFKGGGAAGPGDFGPQWYFHESLLLGIT